MITISASRFASSSLVAALLIPFVVLCTQDVGAVQDQTANVASESGYVLPPAAVQDLLARDPNFVTLDRPSPDRDHFLVPLYTPFSTLERMARQTYRLGMLEVRPSVDRSWHLDTFGIYGMKFYSVDLRAFVDVPLPPDVFLSDFMWSPGGDRIAFLLHEAGRTRVWVAEPDGGEAAPVSDAHVMATIGTDSLARGLHPSRMLQWSGEDVLITLLVPANRLPEPEREPVARSPIIRHTLDRPAPTRTFPFLLTDDYDNALFKYYATTQIAELRRGRAPRFIGTPGMYESISLSPDGGHILAARYTEPFSPVTRYTNFPRIREVLDRDGNVLSVLERRPLQVGIESRPDDGAHPRDWTWRPDDRGLSFIQRDSQSASDGRAVRYDRVFKLEHPFDQEQARVIAISEDRIESVRYSLEGRHAFALLSREGKQAIAHFQLGDAVARPNLLVDFFDPDDVTGHPGELFTERTGNGIEYVVVSSDGRYVFLVGAGLNEDFRPRPFVDRISLVDGAATRVFEGSRDWWERPLAALDQDFSRMIISRESRSSFPDSYLWSADGTVDNLTHNTDPFPELTAARRIDFEFQRRDGIRIQGRLSLPIDYQEGQSVPTVVWTYPREFASAEDYRRAALRTHNRNAFPHMSWLMSSDIWLTQGYARIDPDIPIIADNAIGGHYNDKYIASIRDAMYAAIRAVDLLGMVDIDRLGHGGHSYGAFATANLLAHTPFFKAGIAGSGAYNRTLTPMGFQAEQRTLWEAPYTYFEMSPFFRAHQIETPLLLYHGADDDNTGTYPDQSERLMHALTSLGKTAVLFVYPYESHVPRAIETVNDMWARWIDWFDRYVAANGDATIISGKSDTW